MSIRCCRNRTVGDNLTTKGQPADADYQTIRDLGFEIVRNSEVSHC
jgi:hypothetical protein